MGIVTQLLTASYAVTALDFFEWKCVETIGIVLQVNAQICQYERRRRFVPLIRLKSFKTSNYSVSVDVTPESSFCCNTN